MYRSYSVNSMPQPIISSNEPLAPPIAEHKKDTAAKETIVQKKDVTPSRTKLKTDDLILIIVITVLLFNDCDDKLLLMALAYVFFTDCFGTG